MDLDYKNGIVISGFAAILSRRSCFRLSPIGIGRNSERQFAAPSVKHCPVEHQHWEQKYTLPRTGKNLSTTPAKVLPARVAAIAPSTQWQRERWAALPDVPYKGITFTMPDVLWSLFRDNLWLTRLMLCTRQ